MLFNSLFEFVEQKWSLTTIEDSSKVSIWIKKRNVHAQKTLPKTQLGIYVWLRFVFTFIFPPLFHQEGRGTLVAQL